MDQLDYERLRSYVYVERERSGQLVNSPLLENLTTRRWYHLVVDEVLRFFFET